MTRKVDLAAYDIRLFTVAGILSAEVTELLGCVAAASTAATLEATLEQAIYVYLEDHPEAPRHYLG